MAGQSLKDKTVKGMAWSGIDNMAHTEQLSINNE